VQDKIQDASRLMHWCSKINSWDSAFTQQKPLHYMNSSLVHCHTLKHTHTHWHRVNNNKLSFLRRLWSKTNARHSVADALMLNGKPLTEPEAMQSHIWNLWTAWTVHCHTLKHTHWHWHRLSNNILSSFALTQTLEQDKCKTLRGWCTDVEW
jgi:hypothetical protein